MEMQESEICRVFDNDEFGHWAITVERPLRLRVYPERKIPSGILKAAEEEQYYSIIEKIKQNVDLSDWTSFAKATKLKAGVLKKIRPFITEKDASAKPIAGEPDVELRDTEIVPLTYEGGIEAFLDNEVRTYSPDAYIDESKTTIGYEISFNKYFYKAKELRESETIVKELMTLEKSATEMMEELFGGVGYDSL